MPFLVTYEPVNLVLGDVPITVEIGTAVDAWAEVDGLHLRDQRVTRILTPEGHGITWQELRDLATLP
jgi:hypothetical protein